MRIVIIEDEKPAARRIQSLLEAIDGMQVVVVLESVKRAMDWFEKGEGQDLIFSDIQLGDGLSFEIFSQLDIKTPIVFTTAYNEYALEAFKHNSIAYLLKPFVQEDVEEAINKFKDFPSTSNIDYNILIKEIRGENKPDYRERFLVNKGDQMVALQSEDVALIYSEDKTTLLKDFKGNRFFLKGSLDDLIDTLNPKDFFRISRGMIVHHKSISKISNYFSGTLKLELNPTHDQEVSVSRRRVADFKQWLNS